MSVFFMCNLLLTCSDPLKSTLTSEMLKQFYEMESNIVWKNHLQFFKYFVCQEMKIVEQFHEFLVLQSHKVSSKSDQKQKIFITRTFFVNKQLTLFFNFLQNLLLNFAQNLRECSFNLAGSESGEKSR